MKIRKVAIWSLALVVFAISCGTVPITGRKTMTLIPNSVMNNLSFSEFKSMMAGSKMSGNQVQSEMVLRVGVRIQKAVEQYFAEQKMSSKLKGYQWEFKLVESDEVNAFCMPGGKVVIYTGILPLTKDEEGLAVVMGHEVAHAVAEHGNERMSQGLLISLGGVAIDTALQKYPAETRQLFVASYGGAATVGVLLPFSRKHEYEADRLGLDFMAMAGYNPEKGVDFWQRMAEASKARGGKVPEFLSTHPSDEKRVKNLQTLMPEAKSYYMKSGAMKVAPPPQVAPSPAKTPAPAQTPPPTPGFKTSSPKRK